MFSNQPLPSDTLPEFQHVPYEPLDAKAPWESFWNATFFFVPLLIIEAVGYFLNQVLPNFVFAIAFSVSLLVMIYSYWYCFASHHYKGIAVREQDILFKKGIFWRKVTILPFNRVQHLETHRNPIERKLGLSTLKLYSAGGQMADLQISGLKAQTAAQIRQFILEKAKKGLHGKD